MLPFVNMSGDAEQEYFADGLSEEILNSLTRIDGMQVAGRTSSFQFKGKNEDLRGIGQKLGVASVLEGSVRRGKDAMRITAQLIRVSDGIHVWSQTYDRAPDDTLAVQLDIAEHVAGALDVVLDDVQRERMRQSGVKNVEAFIAFQKGQRLYRDAHDPERSSNLIATLRLANVEFARATALEPDFAAAYYMGTDLYSHIVLTTETSAAERAAALDAARRDLALGQPACARCADARAHRGRPPTDLGRLARPRCPAEGGDDHAGMPAGAAGCWSAMRSGRRGATGLDAEVHGLRSAERAGRAADRRRRELGRTAGSGACGRRAGRSDHGRIRLDQHAEGPRAGHPRAP